jgi:hypothetical protein
MAGEVILAPINFPSLSDQCLICLFLFCLLSRRKKKTERFLHASARGGISRRRIIREQRRKLLCNHPGKEIKRPHRLHFCSIRTVRQASISRPVTLHRTCRHSARGRFRCRHSSKNSTTFLTERRRSRQDRACMCSRGRSTRLAGI